MNTGLSVRAWKDASIALRDGDGYANATAMCQANGKLWSNYQRLDTTAAYIQALASSLDLTPADLVITTTTGPNEFRGTWIHPRLAVDLARWISPEFAVWMDGWFLEQLEHQHQPQAPSLTAEEVARIAMETVRSYIPPIPQLPSDGHHTICCGDAIVSVMADAHSRGHRLITRRLLLDEVVKRFGYCSRTVDNTMPSLIRSRQVVRLSHGRYRLSPLPTASAMQPQQLPLVETPADDRLSIMKIVHQVAAQAGGPITWHDTADHFPGGWEAFPGVGLVWQAMKDLHALGAGLFSTDLKTFQVSRSLPGTTA